MPQGSRNVKKVSETNFPTIKQYIADKGVDAAQTEFGYSARTIRLIKNSADYTVFRTKRRATQAKTRAPKPETSKEYLGAYQADNQFKVPKQAVESVVPTQSVTAPVLKKPGHGRTSQPDAVKPVRQYQPGTFVTQEKHDRDLRNQAAMTNRALAEVGKLGKEVKAITKEEAAYQEADILLADKAKKSRWQRFVQGIREGFRS